MAKIHVLVKHQDASGKGWLEAYTSYGAYGVYSIPEDYQDMRLDLDSIGAEILTPAEAINLGANYLVIGRPIVKSKNPLNIIKKINRSLSN